MSAADTPQIFGIECTLAAIDDEPSDPPRRQGIMVKVVRVTIAKAMR